MIRINLLKTFTATNAGGEDADLNFVQDDEKKLIYQEFAKRFIAFLIGPMALFFYESSNIPTLQSEIANKQQILNDLKQFNEKKKNLAEEIKRYELDQTRLNNQMSFMRRIATEKVNELKLFLYLQDFTPKSLWINKLELKGTELSINGEATYSEDITKFLENLANAQFLTAVSPISQEIKPNSLGQGLSTTAFSVKANFVSTGAVTP